MPTSTSHRFWSSTVGKKAVMGVTGVILILFVLFHLGANLAVFRGPEALNGTAASLDRLGPLLWAARAVLLAAVVLHVVTAAELTKLDLAARPTRYERRIPQAATVASRTIRWSGVVLLAFIVFHVLHLAAGTIQPITFRPEDVYGNVVGGFRVGWVAGIYLASMIALGLHLFHGAWSSARSLGFVRPTATPMRRPIATVIAAILWVGFTSIPLAVQLGGLR